MDLVRASGGHRRLRARVTQATHLPRWRCPAVRRAVLACALALAGAPGLATAGSCTVINGVAEGDCGNVVASHGKAPPPAPPSGHAVGGIVQGFKVEAGDAVAFSGIANGDVDVAAGARLVSTGTINGTLRNRGGEVIVSGVVKRLEHLGGSAVVSGTVREVTGDAPVDYRAGAVVGGVFVQRDLRKVGMP